MKETITGTYRSTHWQEHEYRAVDGGPRLTVAEKESTMDGGIEGTGILRYSVVYTEDGSNVFTGHLCVTGRLGDREGSFVVEDGGTANADRASGTWRIIADSGTGELVGLRGEGTWTWEQGNQDVAYTLTYEL